MITEEGCLSLRAYRIKEHVMKLLKDKTFTKKHLHDLKFSFQDFLEEIPIKLTDYSLTSSVLLNMNGSNLLTPYEEVQLSDNRFLQKNIEGLVQSINELSKENSINFVNWQKNLQKQEQQQQQYIEKRKLENEKNKLPEPSLQELESENPRVFKRPAEPDRFESLLLDYQIDYYCTQVLNYVGNTNEKD